MTSFVIFVAMVTILVGKYEFLSYQNTCSYKMAWRRLNTMCTYPYDTSLEWAGHQLSDEVWDICICVILRKIFDDMCVKWCKMQSATHILIHSSVHTKARQISHTLSESW